MLNKFPEETSPINCCYVNCCLRLFTYMLFFIKIVYCETKRVMNIFYNRNTNKGHA